MRKKIKIGNKEVEFNTSLAWVFIYKAQFGQDPLAVLLPMIKAATKAMVNLNEAEKAAKAKKAEAGKTAKEKTGNNDNTLSFEMLTDMDIDEAFDPLYEIEATEILSIIWALAANADENIEEPEKWLDSFDRFPLDEIGKELLPMIAQAVMSTKKYKALSILTEPKAKTQSSKSLQEE